MVNYSKFLLIFVCFFSVIFAENLTVIGIGRLGLSLALSLEKAGYNVLGVDVSSDYVSKLNTKTLNSPEPYINDYLRTSQNFKATTSLQEGLEFSDSYFILVSTTTGVDGYDFNALSALLTEINAYRISNKKIIICSTLFPGYVRNTACHLLQDCKNVDISYNPPFIAQGTIIQGLRNPDMVLIGEGSLESGEFLQTVYESVCLNTPYIARMSVESAEIAKLALNCFVTAKIAFANLIGDIADETPGADKVAILDAIGKDQRIGSRCLLPGFGFGGPCFTRDNRGLSRYATLKGINPLLFNATDQVNDLHALFMAKKLLEQNLDEYIFEDVSYKPNCPVKIIEASQKVEVAKHVAEHGKLVTIRDTEEVIHLLKEKYGNLFNYVNQ